MIWNESEEKLETFLKNLNEFHPNLRFTSEKSKTSVNFLDLTINLVDQELETNLYCKPTDCHQFLDFNSAHPIHIKKSIVYSQGLRIKRLCSSNLAFENHMENLRGWFRNRGYPKNLVDNQLKRVIETSSISRCTRQRENGVPLVLTYHPRFSRVNSIIKQQLMFLYAEEQVKNVFTPPPFVSFRTGFTLKSHLVRAKVHPLLRVRRSSCCNKSRCQTCINVKNTDTFQSFVTKESYKINHHFNCDSKCVVYLLSCKVCGLQYVGSTVDDLD